MRKKTKLCLVPGCKGAIPRGNVFCNRHWFATPAEIRGRIRDAMNRHHSVDKAKAVSEALKIFLRGEK